MLYNVKSFISAKFFNNIICRLIPTDIRTNYHIPMLMSLIYRINLRLKADKFYQIPKRA